MKQAVKKIILYKNTHRDNTNIHKIIKRKKVRKKEKDWTYYMQC